MSNKTRIELVRDAIKSVKRRAQVAVNNGRIQEFSELMLDLGGLEQCYDIEVDTLLEKQAMKDFEALLEQDKQSDNNVVSIKKAA